MMAEHDKDVIHAWQEAQLDLGIEVEAPFTFQAPDGSARSALALIKKFGRVMGTVIASINDDYNALFADARAAGYFCSAPNSVSYSTYRREDFIATLNDWGWFGEDEEKPDWYTGTPWGA